MPLITNADTDNTARGDFGEAWLEVIASASNLDHGVPATRDRKKGDIQLTLVDGDVDATVIVQVKTDINLKKNDDGTFTYNLDAASYNYLVNPRQEIRRVLVVIGLRRNADNDANIDTHELGENSTLLLGEGAWVSLRGMPATTNKSTKAVVLPADNKLDDSGLTRMIRTAGRPRTPSVEPWDDWSQS